MSKTYQKKSYFITHSAVLALLVVFVILANVLTANWDSALTDFFGTVGGTKTSAQIGDFVSEFASEEALRAAQLDFTRRVVGEGTVLLKNSNNALPLQTGAKVSVFGLASRSASKDGEGSGDIKIDSDNLAGALEKAGFSVNPKLSAFIAASKHEHGTGAGPGNGTAMGECA